MRRFWLLLAVFSLACSSAAEAPPATSDGAVEDGAAPAVDTGSDGSTHDTADAAEAADSAADSDAGDDVASDGPLACNSIELTGDLVTMTRVAADPPTLAGGTLVDGTYVLTNLVEYTGPGGATGSGSSMRATLVLSGGTYESKSLKSATEYSVRGTFTHDASSVTFSESCAGSAVATAKFETTSSTLKLLQAGTGSAQIELTYEKK